MIIHIYIRKDGTVIVSPVKHIYRRRTSKTLD